MIKKEIELAYSKYPCPMSAKKVDNVVMCLYEGDVFQGGLADRLRGIISVYMTCKEKGLNFKLAFKHPFDIEWYLQPNLYDWRMPLETIEKDLDKIEILVLDSTSDSTYHSKKQKKWMEKHLISKNKQYHCYTNAFYSYDYDYGSLFNELFKLSPRLANKIAEVKRSIGGEYISISCRFLDLLGDFNESFGHDLKLSGKEKDRLIEDNISAVARLHEEYPGKRILANSDSVTFLEYIKKLPYVYVVSGNITHIDNVAVSTYETFEKTFLDFFMIANADRIFCLKTGAMRLSGYPYAASQIYSKPFKNIVF